MHARVTQLEIDAVRTDVETAVELFKDAVLPGLVEEPGYRGALVLATPEGAGILVSFWDTEEQAEVSDTGGFYADTLERFMTLFRSPPGRERYEVKLIDLPALADT